ncbi:syntaxin-1A-like [Acipenser oxyrinchus oxyrinchus]|uniref:Syntaxin-1A-like n=1 Tax=Acipenser oxyrinchus oxyrinchus TaxID=40147 RepID=A0AAD8D6F6_ACIOX|nr:syntaxin-1A-like [Acipenser oxyrinchus oxyrinchus]
MKDRLEELKNLREDDEGFPDDDFPGYDNPCFHEEVAKEMEEFFRTVSDIAAELDGLEDISEDIAKKQAQVLCSTAMEAISAEKKLLGDLKNEFTGRAKGIQAHLGQMKEASPFQGMCVEGRIRQCQFNVLAQRHKAIMVCHFAKEMEYVGRLKEQIKRQTELAGLELAEEDLQMLVESPSAPQIVGSDIHVLEAQKHLALAHERHLQLLALEAQISELHGLFFHLEVLVSEQQGMVDNIEHNVIQAMDYISQSNEQVKKALKYQRKSRIAAVFSAVLGMCACCACLSCVSTVVPRTS